MALQQGDIVLVNVLDPQGQPCRTPHPAMIITRTDRIAKVERIWVAVISSAFTVPLQDGWKKLPFRAKPQPPHPVTGLWKECVLKCDWRKSIEKTDIQEELGGVPLSVLEWAIPWIKAHEEKLRRERNS